MDGFTNTIGFLLAIILWIVIYSIMLLPFIFLIEGIIYGKKNQIIISLILSIIVIIVYLYMTNRI